MILLVNDDGIAAPGLRILYRVLRRELRRPVLAVAPAQEHSGMGHAITINRGLSVRSVTDSSDDFFGFAVGGTPADCCKLGLKVLATKTPVLVVSGINDGPNVGRSLFYSGTVGAALEAAVEGVPAIAVSLDRSDQPPWEAAAEWVAQRCKELLRSERLSEFNHRVINYNLPATVSARWDEPQLVPHGLSGFRESYRLQRQKDDQHSWMLHGERIELAHEGTTDAHLLRAGYPTITVLEPSLNVDSSMSDHLRDTLLGTATLPAGAPKS